MQYREKFIVHLEDTSAYDNAYFITYHKWVAITKENFFIKEVKDFSDYFHNKGMNLFVLRSALKLFAEAKLHDEIYVDMSCVVLKKLKAELLFKIFNKDNKLLAQSNNVIIFMGSDKKVIPIPDNARKALEAIVEVVK
jgi:acyl-CoA thioesterase FadM